MVETKPVGRIELDPRLPVWDRCFLVAPLVLIATREPDGSHDLAPKHLAMPVSWENYFGFVCTPRHATCRNAEREGWFTASFPRPDQVLLTSFAAAPRCEDETKPALGALETVPASTVEGVLLKDAYLHLECRLERLVDGLGENTLVIGSVQAASVAEDALREDDVDDQDLLVRAPLLAYLYPGRFSLIGESQAFPFHAGFSR